MSFQITWGRGVGQATVTTVEELDSVLDGIGCDPDGIPYSVGIIARHLADENANVPPMLDICIGHPTRSFVYHVGIDGDSAWGFEPHLPPMPEVYANHGGSVDEAWPERTRVSPATARQAAREFLAGNARRPSCLSWDTGDNV